MAGSWLLKHSAIGRRSHVAVSHWDIENPLHWTLDMVFDEDHSRARFGHAAENLAIMRHFAFDMICCDKVMDGPVRFAECFSVQQPAISSQQNEN